MQSKALLWALVALLYCFCYSSSYAQNLNTGTACPNLYSGSTQQYTVPSGVTYSTGVICNETSIESLLGASILTIDIPNDSNGNPIGAYNTDTDTFTFNSNSANVAQTATFAINAALQAAGIGIQFRGFKYEWEMIKPTASSIFSIGVKIYSNTNEGIAGNGLIYSSSHNYTGTAFSDWTAKNSGGAGTPPFKFVVKDEWTVEAKLNSNSDNNQLRGLKYTWTYNPVVGHENDFSTTYVYPGQEAAEQSDFDYQCSLNPQFSPGCPGYTDPSIDTGETTTTAELNTEEDQIASTGITNEISNSALQSGTNIDGTLNTEVVDLGVMPEDAPLMDGTEIDIQETDSIIILDVNLLEIGTDIPGILLTTQEEMDTNGSIIDPSLPEELNMTGNLSILPEISVQGEVSTSLTGKISTVPESSMPDLIELEVSAPPVLNIAGPSIEPEPTAVSATGTISPIASLPRALTSIQRDALSVASTTTSAAINITSTQSRASITSGDSQVAYSSSSDASGTSSNSGSDGGFNIVQNNDGSTGNNDNNDTSSRNTGSNNFGTLSDGNININSIASDSSISSLNQSGPQGVFSTKDTGGASNFNENQLALGNTSVSYEESNEILFGTVVIPQLDFTIREMIDSIIKRIFADGGMVSDTSLDEVSESELKQQQNIEDNLVKDALGGSTSEDAQAALLGYNPLFRSYVVPQIYDQVVSLYETKDIYPEQTTYDNPHARFFNGASDELHRSMVRQQYGDK
tara:strand:+ start:12609 stop:14843 length:2235 start_codon:yes stop_codon:yes gene_type:complete